VTLAPLAFVGITTFVSGILNITGIYLPQLATDKFFVQGLINLILTLVIMLAVVIIVKDAIPGWVRK
jgi:ABC-type bacteriocin/lantibiotic exporter with double-glycine peptidase domain